MISYAEALKIIKSEARGNDSTCIAISSAVGRVCRQEVKSPESVPPFDNSAMDGFAIKTSEINGSKFTVLGTVAAGDAPRTEKTSERGVWEIMTGAPVPEGFDSVVKVEDVKVKKNASGQPAEIELTGPVKPGQHVRYRGEDFQRGKTFLTPGSFMMPEHVMALAMLGVGEIQVSSTPRVAVISTGSELSDYSTQQLPLGYIRNSSAPYLISELQKLNTEAKYFGIVKDDPKEFFQTMDKVFEFSPDVVITTGAVSMGRYDFVGSALKDLGAEILFHKVAIRPGKPLLFSKLKKDSKEMVFFGVPGNPISTAVGLRFFIEPYLRKLVQREPEAPLKAALKENFKKPKGLRCFFRAQSEVSVGGNLEVTVLSRQSSAVVSSFLGANSWAILPEEEIHVAAGTLIDTVPLHGWDYRYSNEVLDGK